MNYKLCFYVPKSHTEQVKQALFEKGAGKIGHYDCCAWQTLGQGQFRPNAEAKPFLGEAEKIETVPEHKVEMICEERYLPEVLAALKASHPYEVPAYDVWKLETL